MFYYSIFKSKCQAFFRFAKQRKEKAALPAFSLDDWFFCCPPTLSYQFRILGASHTTRPAIKYTCPMLALSIELISQPEDVYTILKDELPELRTNNISSPMLGER